MTRDDIEGIIADADQSEIVNLFDYLLNECAAADVVDEMEDWFAEFAESQDPRSMGWVGDNGLP